MVYCVDLREKTTGDTFMTIFRSDDYDTVWEVANTYNNIHGITEHEYALLEQGETEGWTSHPYWASVQNDCEEIIEPESKEDKEMNYQEQIKKAVQEFYDVTKAFATSRHYTLSYWWVESNFGLDLSDKKVKSDVHEMTYSNEFGDLIQAVDFDDDKKEVLIMIWESNNKKKYTLENYKEFCEKALICPPFEDEENWQKWIDEHKIQIIANNCVMELDYDADAVNEIEFGLREIHEAILGSGEATTGNTVGSEYPNATWKDILRLYVFNQYYNGTEPLKIWVKECIYRFEEKEFVNTMKDINPSINDEFEVNFFKLDTTDLWKIFNEEERRRAFKEILCSNVDIDELIDKDGKHADKVVITDSSINPSGDIVGWHYGVDFDKHSDDNQYYIQKYIEEATGND